MNKEIIARNFSRCAHLYDRYADIQRLAAKRLIDELQPDGIRDILEIGCGTGIYTYYLKDRFAKARIDALDISPKMVEIASCKLKDDRTRFFIADAEDVELKRRFDLVTSNATFQWFTQTERSIAKYKDALTEKGILAFSIFGQSTFRELKDALKMAFGKEASLSSGYFLNREGIEKILVQNFKTFVINESILKEKYVSVLELLKKIKYTGARGDGMVDTSTSLRVDKFVWNKAMLRRLDDVYKARFGHIEASYQIFFCKAVKA